MTAKVNEPADMPPKGLAAVATDGAKVTIALQFTGPQATAIRTAMTQIGHHTAVGFATAAIANEVEAALGEGSFPASPPKARKVRPVPADAEALGLDAKEYARRVRALKAAGVEPTREAVGRVPARPSAPSARVLDTAAE